MSHKVDCTFNGLTDPDAFCQMVWDSGGYIRTVAGQADAISVMTPNTDILDDIRRKSPDFMKKAEIAAPPADEPKE